MANFPKPQILGKIFLCTNLTVTNVTLCLGYISATFIG